MKIYRKNLLTEELYEVPSEWEKYEKLADLIDELIEIQNKYTKEELIIKNENRNNSSSQ